MFEIAKAIAGDCAGIAVVAGVLAAVYWFRSAATPLKASDVGRFLADPKGHAEFAQWLNRGAHLNKWAAIWTGVSVLASGLSVALDHWPGG